MLGNQAFKTHLNYADCLRNLTSGLTINLSFTLRRAGMPYLATKDNLIRLTRQSLRDERDIVRIDNEYSYASTSWLPVKSYYLIFNNLLTIEYLINLQRAAFSMTHAACMREFTRKLGAGEISFSNPTLNQVFDGSIFNYHGTATAHLTPHRTPTPDMFKLAMKKVAEYKLEDWKRTQRIPSFRSPAHRRLKANYLSTFKISFFEFPYFMRIRANYRDFAFIDGVSAAETADYFNSYLGFVANINNALERLRRRLIRQRT